MGPPWYSSSPARRDPLPRGRGSFFAYVVIIAICIRRCDDARFVREKSYAAAVTAMDLAGSGAAPWLWAGYQRRPADGRRAVPVRYLAGRGAPQQSLRGRGPAAGRPTPCRAPRAGTASWSAPVRAWWAATEGG